MPIAAVAADNDDHGDDDPDHDDPDDHGYHDHADWLMSWILARNFLSAVLFGGPSQS